MDNLRSKGYTGENIFTDEEIQILTNLHGRLDVPNILLQRFLVNRKRLDLNTYTRSPWKISNGKLSYKHNIKVIVPQIISTYHLRKGLLMVTEKYELLLAKYNETLTIESISTYAVSRIYNSTIVREAGDYYCYKILFIDGSIKSIFGDSDININSIITDYKFCDIINNIHALTIDHHLCELSDNKIFKSHRLPEFKYIAIGYTGSCYQSMIYLTKEGNVLFIDINEIRTIDLIDNFGPWDRVTIEDGKFVIWKGDKNIKCKFHTGDEPLRIEYNVKKTKF